MEWMAMPWVTGAGFLPIYAGVLVSLLALAAVLRWHLRAPGEGAPGRTLGTYEAAYLAGGPERALAAALGALLESGTLAIERAHGGPPRTRLARALARDAAPLERALATCAGAALWDRGLRGRLRALPEVHALREQLEADELLLSRDEAQRARAWPVVVMSLGVLFGIPRLVRGLSLHRPSGLLVVFIAAALLATLMISRRACRTRRGDAALDVWRRLTASSSRPLPDAVLIGIAGAGAVVAVSAAFDATAAPVKRNSDGSIAFVDGCGIDGGGGSGGGGGGGDGGGGGGGCGGGGCGGCGGGGGE